MDIQVQYALEVMEGIAATVEQGVYRLISYTPLNPLALDSTAMALLEEAAGTSLDVIKNDLGEVVGYCAKGAAQAGNGTSTDVSTQISVLTKEVVVDAEMASQEWKDIATGETATLTIGQTITTVFATAGQSIAGILALSVPAAGAAIGCALGIVSGMLLYNIAPEFWTDVADELMQAGELVAGKVKAILNSNKQTSFKENVIEIYKNAFLNAGFFDDSMYIETDDPNLTLKDLVNQPFRAEEDMSKTFLYYENSAHTELMGITVPEQVRTTSKNYALFVEQPEPLGSDCRYLFVGANNQEPISYNISFAYDVKVAYGNSSGGTGLSNYGMISPVNILPSGVTTSELAADDDVLKHITWLLAYSTIKRNEQIQDDATLPTADPFTQTYPDWQPSDNVQGDDYYPVSMPTDQNTQAPSQTGDNDDDEQEDIIGGLLFNPDPIPLPQPKPDPDPQPEPDSEPDTDVPTPVTDPTNPNPEPDPSDPSPTLPIIAGVHASKMMSIYNPTDGEVDDLGAFLWVDNIIEQIRLIFQDPMDGIISLHKIYAQPVTGTRKDIILGYIDSGVDALEVTNQFTTVNCGSVSIAEERRNATDYPPYTQAHIYLPFIGIEEIDVAEIMGGTVRVQYRVDAYTGTCVAQIFVTRSADMASEQMLYTFSGNASQTIPLTSSNFTGLVSSLVSIAGGAATAGAGGALLAAGRGLTTHMASVSHSGSISANAGIMGPRKPYIILTRQKGYDANGYNSIYGYPANTTRYLSNCSGYVRVKDVLYRGDGTEEEKREIVSLLKEGVLV